MHHRAASTSSRAGGSVAGFQLFASGRVHEAGRCFREALNLYLDRIGRVRAQPELNRGTSGEEGRAAVARIMSDPAAAAALGSETSNIVSADAPPDVPPRLDELPGRRAPSPRPRSPPPPFFRDEDERRAVAREYDAQLRAQRRSSDAFEPRSA